MQTTLDIEDDVLQAAQQLAQAQNMSASEMISRLIRKALASEQLENSNIFQPFPSRGKVVTNEQIDQIRDHEGV